VSELRRLVGRTLDVLADEAPRWSAGAAEALGERRVRVTLSGEVMGVLAGAGRLLLSAHTDDGLSVTISLAELVALMDGADLSESVLADRTRVSGRVPELLALDDCTRAVVRGLLSAPSAPDIARQLRELTPPS